MSEYSLIYDEIEMARKRDYNLREKILRAALEMTSDPEFINFTTARIARAADVSEGTLYNYFQSKDHLIDSLFEFAFKNYLTQLDARISDSRNLRERLRGMITFHIEYFASRYKLFSLIFIAGENSTSPAGILKKLFLPYKLFIEDVLNQGKNELKTGVNTNYIASFLLGSVQILVLEETISPGKVNLDKALDQLFKLFDSFMFVKKM